MFKTIVLLVLAAGASAFVPSSAKAARRVAPLQEAIAGIEKRADGMAQVCAHCPLPFARVAAVLYRGRRPVPRRCPLTVEWHGLIVAAREGLVGPRGDRPKRAGHLIAVAHSDRR